LGTFPAPWGDPQEKFRNAPSLAGRIGILALRPVIFFYFPLSKSRATGYTAYEC